MTIIENTHIEQLKIWYRLHGRHNLAWRKLETPWAIFVAESLLRRTNASIVAKVYGTIIDEFRCPEEVIERKARWREATSCLGLASRAENFFQACDQIVHQHHGKVPNEYRSLLALPGVGHYIASSVICFGYQYPTYIIDTNTLRIASRISGEEIKQEQHRSKKAKEMLVRCFGEADGLPPELNYALLDLAFSVCKPKKPDCANCPLIDCCHTGSIVLS